MRALYALFGALLVAAGSQAVLAQASGDFAITREVVAGGGAAASGGTFTLVGTASQYAPGRASGGDFLLHGGFHVPDDAQSPRDAAIFRDGFEGALP